MRNGRRSDDEAVKSSRILQWSVIGSIPVHKPAIQAQVRQQLNTNGHCEETISTHERMPMIARHWRGWTDVHNADAYEALLKTRVLPELKLVAGYHGGYILRSEGAVEVEFVVVNFFESIESVRVFAGDDYSTPVFEPEARLLLSRVEPIARHYEVRASTV